MALTETPHAGSFILSLAPGNLSLDNGKLNAGQDLAAGTVVARLLAGVGAKVSGTGDGAISAITIGKDAEVGVYTLTGKSEASNVGTFSVRTPSGNALPDLTVAAAYSSSHISLTVADGANDWDIGDIITVTVTAGDFEALDVAEDDGAQIAGGILLQSINATSADVVAAFVVRSAEVIGAQLTWPVGITDNQKLAAIAQLAQSNIIVR